MVLIIGPRKWICMSGTVQQGLIEHRVARRTLLPRYIGLHAGFLNAAPRLAVAIKPYRTFDRAHQRGGIDRRELDAGGAIALERRFIGIDDRIGKAADM